MSGTAYSALLVAVMSAATILLRAAPFLIFRKKAPAYVMYLGRVLPPAIPRSSRSRFRSCTSETA